ncbi:MAG: hypothetical protein ABIO88_09060 [Burkholderiaceae bacterium]
MNDVISAVLRLLLRVVWVISGLILLISLMLAAVLAALVLGLRYGWARLTGKPVKPFIFSSFTQGQGTPWGQFKSTTDAWTAKATGPFAGPFSGKAKVPLPVADVTDVESRPSKSSGPSS